MITKKKGLVDGVGIPDGLPGRRPQAVILAVTVLPWCALAGARALRCCESRVTVGRKTSIIRVCQAHALALRGIWKWNVERWRCRALFAGIYMHSTPRVQRSNGDCSKP